MIACVEYPETVPALFEAWPCAEADAMQSRDRRRKPGKPNSVRNSAYCLATVGHTHCFARSTGWQLQVCHMPRVVPKLLHVQARTCAARWQGFCSRCALCQHLHLQFCSASPDLRSRCEHRYLMKKTAALRGLACGLCMLRQLAPPKVVHSK